MKFVATLSVVASLVLMSSSMVSADEHGKCMSKDGKTEITTAKDKASCEKQGGVWSNS